NGGRLAEVSEIYNVEGSIDPNRDIARVVEPWSGADRRARHDRTGSSLGVDARQEPLDEASMDHDQPPVSLDRNVPWSLPGRENHPVPRHGIDSDHRVHGRVKREGCGASDSGGADPAPRESG